MQLAIQYAQAIYELGIDATPKQKKHYIDALFALLQRKGHKKLLPDILKEYQKIVVAGAEKKAAKLTIVNKKQAEPAKLELKKYASFAGSMTLHEDDTLIGGFVYDDGDTVIDGSYKQALLTLYRTLTA